MNFLSAVGWEAGVALIIAICTAIYVAGQVQQATKQNNKDIETIRATLLEEQEGTRELIRRNQEAVLELIRKNMSDMKAMLEVQKEYQRDSLNREISHIKDLISMSNNEMREDIKRLENAQRESNRVKERLAIAESSLKSLHHRLDLEPPVLKKVEEEE